MIRKTLTFGVIALAGLGLLAPWVVSRQIALNHDDYAERLAIPGALELTEASLDRGWLRSRSRIALKPVGRLCPRADCAPVTVESTIHHGPIAFTAPTDADTGLTLVRGVVVSRLRLAAALAPLRFKPQLPSPRAVTRIHWNGETESRVGLDEARLVVEAEGWQGEARWKPLSGHARRWAARELRSARLTWPGVKLFGPPGQLEWSALTMSVATEPGHAAYGLSLGVVRAVATDGPALALHELETDGEWRGGRQAWTHAGSLRIASLLWRGQEYGPLLASVEMDNLDAEALLGLRRALTGLRGAGWPPPAGAWVEASRRYLPALLAPGPDMSVPRLLLGTPDGDVTGELHLKTPTADGRTVADWLADVSLTARAQVPKPLAVRMLDLLVGPPGTPAAQPEKADAPPADLAAPRDARLEAMIARNWIQPRPADAAYAVELRLRDGRLRLNGEPVDAWERFLERLRAAEDGLGNGDGAR